MGENVGVDTSEIVVRVFVALAAGIAVGVEREARGHEAGVGTHTLVALGAVVFTLAGAIGFSSPDGGGDDPWRIAAQVASGIGFIGAGTIIQSRGSVKGLTTAASLWLTAGVGVAAGVGGLALVGVATAAAIFLLLVREVVPLPKWRQPHRTASVTVVHAERDGLAATLAAVLAAAGGPVTVRTEPSAHRDGGPRWRTTIQVDRAAVGPVVERLQGSPATLELHIEEPEA
jgi:putative Mg2+ transporter-C (MgtC) family protein